MPGTIPGLSDTFVIYREGEVHPAVSGGPDKEITPREPGPKPQPSRRFSSVMSPRTEARRFTCRCATEVAVRDLAVAGPPSPRTPGPMGIFAEAPMYTDRMVGPFRTPRTG